MTKYNYKGSQEFRPLSPWAYFGYSVLFTVPFIGLIVNLVFCFGSENINRRNYARSFWCAYLLAAIIIAVFLVAAPAIGITADSVEQVIDGVSNI